MSMRKPWPGAAVLAATLALSLSASADTTEFVDERTGLKGWKFERDGIRVQLIQRLPDQTKAFFFGRGFAAAAANRLADRCLFQTIVHNTLPAGGDTVAVDLHDWRVLNHEQPAPLLLKRHWQEIWAQMKVPAAARTAFQWAFFPTRQEFAPGDWNMGMTSYPVAPGQPLHLEVVWHNDGRRHTGTIEGPVCGANDMAAEVSQ